MSPVPVLVQRKINDFCIKFPTQKFFLVLLLDGKDCYVEDSSDNAIGFNKCTQDWWKDNKEQLSRSEFRLFEYCEYVNPNQRITEVTNNYKTGRFEYCEYVNPNQRITEVTHSYKTGRAWKIKNVKPKPPTQ